MLKKDYLFTHESEKTVSLDLKDIDKQQGHPSIKGMKEIAKQVTDYLKRE